MSEPDANGNDLGPRIAAAKDRLSRLLETAANDGDSSQVRELIVEEEAEILRLETSRDEAEFIGGGNGIHLHPLLARSDNEP